MLENKEIKFCPYCGSDKIKFVRKVPRCTICRSVFFVSFSRTVRKSPKSKNTCTVCGYEIAENEIYCGECVCEKEN